MIVVTGATGALGSATVRALLDRVPADQLGVSVRDPEKAADLAALGVRVRAGDFADPASLAHAFDGADRVLLVSGSTLGPEGVALHTAAARAAVDAGAQRVFYTAHQNTRAASPVAFSVDHAQTEAALAEVGAPWTSLRNGFYAHTVGWLIAGAVESGELLLPEDGPISWTDRDDLAVADAVLLSGGPEFDGPTPALTAPEAVTFADVARILSDVSGTTVRRTVIDDDEWVDRQVRHGMPDAAAQLMLGMFRGARAGEFDEVDPLLGELLGRRPVSIRTAIERAVA
ncbi:NmrA family NAD(P)-binding protein [Curtobacterium sp. 9128]|uniref:NmrA family NAD(P)-binding protein n=1 Tax=Curtobacterium sp. 9128 TaxID=1793722 RepID=UPI0011A3271F|nr:NmrA family NAD(P)-binding protein [Curtobacterium sp. 9128]